MQSDHLTVQRRESEGTSNRLLIAALVAAGPADYLLLASALLHPRCAVAQQSSCSAAAALRRAADLLLPRAADFPSADPVLPKPAAATEKVAAVPNFVHSVVPHMVVPHILPEERTLHILLSAQPQTLLAEVFRSRMRAGAVSVDAVVVLVG